MYLKEYVSPVQNKRFNTQSVFKVHHFFINKHKLRSMQTQLTKFKKNSTEKPQNKIVFNIKKR